MRHIITTSIALPVGYKHGPRCDTKYAIHFALDKNLPSNIHLQPGMHYNWHYHDDWEDDTILNIIDWENETVLSNLIKKVHYDPQNNLKIIQLERIIGKDGGELDDWVPSILKSGFQICRVVGAVWLTSTSIGTIKINNPLLTWKQLRPHLVDHSIIDNPPIQITNIRTSPRSKK